MNRCMIKQMHKLSKVESRWCVYKCSLYNFFKFAEFFQVAQKNQKKSIIKLFGD